VQPRPDGTDFCSRFPNGGALRLTGRPRALAPLRAECARRASADRAG